MTHRGTVLVIDDDPLVLKLTRARLEGAGFQVETREEALGSAQVILAQRPDIVLIDMKMPALSGDMIAEIVAKSPRSGDIGIIFHSSEELASLQEKARRAGAIGAISKTGQDDFFVAQFERLFARQQRRKNPA